MARFYKGFNMEFIKMAFDFATSDLGYALLAAGAGAVGFLWVRLKSSIKQLKKSYSISHLVETDIQVYTHLSDLMVTTGAVRAFVFQFHNGVFYLNASNQMKMSCTHEVVKEGFSKEGKSMQDILISRYPKSIGEIVQHEYVVLNEAEEETNFYQLLKSQGVKVAILSKLALNDNAEGFIGITFWEGQELEWLEHDEENVGKQVADHASTIGYLLRGKK